MFKSDALFRILNHVLMKGNYQTHSGNFITSQLIIKITRTVLWACSVSSWLTIKLLTRSHFLWRGYFVVCHYLWVCWLRRCLWTLSAGC